MPLSLFAHPDLGMVVNREVPTFTRDELASTLAQLFAAGDLGARLDGLRDPNAAHRIAATDLQELLPAGRL